MNFIQVEKKIGYAYLIKAELIAWNMTINNDKNIERGAWGISPH